MLRHRVHLLQKCRFTAHLLPKVLFCGISDTEKSSQVKTKEGESLLSLANKLHKSCEEFAEASATLEQLLEELEQYENEFFEKKNGDWQLELEKPVK